MLPKVWNAMLPPFPREGLNHLLPSENCQVTMLMRKEAARLARLAQFDMPNPTMESLKKFQRTLRAKLWEKLGAKYDPSLPLDVTEYGTIDCGDHTITRLIYQSRPGIYVTALLYRPKEGKGPFPGAIHVHGHHADGNLAELVQKTVTALVKRGYVCLSIDAFGVFERASNYMEKEYHGGFLGSSLFNIGESLMGAQLVDNMRGMDLMCSLPYVDKKHIGVTGASGGGNQTMWLAAMDTRVAAAMPVVSVGSFESYVTGVNCVCEQLPDGLTFTEETGVLALIAPRPLRIGNAHYDVNPTFGVEEMLKTYRQVEKLYRDLGKADNIAYTVAPHVHGFRPAMREAMLGWFDWHLRGIGHGGTLDAPEYETLDYNTLRTFQDGKRSPKVRTTAEHCIITGKELRKKMLETESFNATAKRRELAKLLRLRQLPAGNLFKYNAIDGYERFALDISDHLIPFLVKPGTAKGKFRLLLNADGKENFTDAEIAEAAADGATLVICDLFGEGETAQPNIILGVRSQLMRQLLWVGRSIPGEWIFDIFALLKVIKKDFKATEVDIKAYREAGACAVFAAAIKPGEFTVDAVDAPATMLFSKDAVESFCGVAFKPKATGCLYSQMLATPNFLKWGDISLAVALAGDAVKFTAPRAYDGALWSDSKIAEFNDEVALLKKKLN